MARSSQYSDSSRHARIMHPKHHPALELATEPAFLADNSLGDECPGNSAYGEIHVDQRKSGHHLLPESGFAPDSQFLVEEDFDSSDGRAGAIKGWIQHDTYNQIRNKFGEEGVQKFVDAMNKGVFVRADGQPGIKKFPGRGYSVDGSMHKYKYEIKVVHRQYGNYRVYGNYDVQSGYIIFDKFCEARGHTKKRK